MKDYPFFKFEPSQYLSKDISFCSLSAQGLFINICSYYWQRGCKISKDQIIRRFNYENELNELINEGIIDINNNDIVIKFLDVQYAEIIEKSEKNSKNGKKGGRPKKANENPNESEAKANENPNESETKGIREEKRREDNREDKNRKEEENNTKENFIKIGDFQKIQIEENFINDFNSLFEKPKLDWCIKKLDAWLQTKNKTCKSYKSFKAYCTNWVEGAYEKSKTEQNKPNTDNSMFWIDKNGNKMVKLAI